MTEVEWVAGDDPIRMLEFVQGGASERKLRLFFAAAARSVWIEQDQELGTAVDAAERYADGLVGESELDRARDAVARPLTVARLFREASPYREVDWRRACRLGVLVTKQVSVTVKRGLAFAPCRQMMAEASPALLRDIVGNPFRPVGFDPRWRAGAALTLATQMYEAREFNEMPRRRLADALEDAGCDEPDVLTHCRGPGPHARGCWVVDCVLGKA